MDKKDYVIMLRESLEKKIDILKMIRQKNARQREILLDELSTPDELDDNFEEKGKLVDQIVALDDGFETLYEKVREAVESDRAAYADEIKKMQGLIPQINDLSNEIQAEEQRNRNLASKRFSSIKQRVQKVRTGQRAANIYYQNMMKRNNIDPQFMDHKE